MKRYIDITSISKGAIFKLFVSLISPIVSYGCQVWLPRTKLINCVLNDGRETDKEIMTAISTDPMEKLHLSLLKWTLGVKRKTVNIPMWGDTGRYPIGISMIKLLIDFHNRLVALNDNDSPLIVRHAFAEQKTLNLQWFNVITQLCSKFDPNTIKHCMGDPTTSKPNSLLVKDRLED